MRFLRELLQEIHDKRGDNADNAVEDIVCVPDDEAVPANGTKTTDVQSKRKVTTQVDRATDSLIKTLWYYNDADAS